MNNNINIEEISVGDDKMEMTFKEIDMTFEEIEKERVKNDTLYFLGKKEYSDWKYTLEMLIKARTDLISIMMDILEGKVKGKQDGKSDNL